MKQKRKAKYYVVCIKNKRYEVSLERRKIYQTISDKTASDRDLIRIIDESGQSYLYPNSCFVAITLSQPVQKAIARAA